MEPPPAIIPAVSVALRKGDRLLLVKRGRAPAKGLLAFPGGRVETGESLEQAARRELMEETGLRAGELSIHAVVDLPSSEPGAIFRLTVFAGPHAGGEPIAADDAETADWYGLEEMSPGEVTASVLTAARAMLQDTGGRAAGRRQSCR